jgi:hypothetical protein
LNSFLLFPTVNIMTLIHFISSHLFEMIAWIHFLYSQLLMEWS